MDITSIITDAILQLGAMNVAYLGISMALLAGGLYLFSIKPFKEILGQQEKNLIDLKNKVNEVDKKIDLVTKLEEKLRADEKRLSDVEDRTVDQTLNNIWIQHYVAQSTNNFGGDIIALVWYLQYTQLFKRGDIKMCLEQIKRVLDQDSGSLPSSVVNMKSWNPKIVTQMFSDILVAFNTIQEFDELKEEIKTKAIEKWSLSMK